LRQLTKEKKVLFVIPSIKIGGIENALLNMLEHFDYSKYDVYLFVFHLDEERSKKINKNVKVLTGGRLLDAAAMTLSEAKSTGKITYISRVALAVACKVFGSNSVFKAIFFFEKSITDMDCVISYSNNVNLKTTYFGANLFALTKVRATKKIAWLHVDYDAMHMDSAVNNNEYRSFDGVIAVSKAVKDSFVRCNPMMSEKTHVVYNVLPKNAYTVVKQESDRLEKKIVTVGRLDPNKNQIECIKIAHKLKEDGISFKWYLIGDGQDRQTLEQHIGNAGLQNEVLITGYTDDVKGLIGDADLFVSTSLSESYGMAVVEAQAMGVPAVVKEYPAAKEIVDGENGILVSDYDTMYQEIKKLLIDEKVYKRLKDETKVLCNDKESMEHLYDIIDSL